MLYLRRTDTADCGLLCDLESGLATICKAAKLGQTKAKITSHAERVD